jgi:FAD binding domain
MSAPSALIAGASIAGPALAYWLNRYGWRTTIVGRAPRLRTGGQSVDLKGPGLEVIRRMGLEEQVRAAHPGELGLEFVGPHGQVLARFPVGDASGLSLTSEVEILRGDLAELLVSATADSTEYRFGDRITSVQQEQDAAIAGAPRPNGSTSSSPPTASARTPATYSSATRRWSAPSGWRRPGRRFRGPLRTPTGGAGSTLPAEPSRYVRTDTAPCASSSSAP